MYIYIYRYISRCVLDTGAFWGFLGQMYGVCVCVRVFACMVCACVTCTKQLPWSPDILKRLESPWGIPPVPLVLLLEDRVNGPVLHAFPPCSRLLGDQETHSALTQAVMLVVRVRDWRESIINTNSVLCQLWRFSVHRVLKAAKPQNRVHKRCTYL